MRLWRGDSVWMVAPEAVAFNPEFAEVSGSMRGVMRNLNASPGVRSVGPTESLQIRGTGRK